MIPSFVKRIWDCIAGCHLSAVGRLSLESNYSPYGTLFVSHTYSEPAPNLFQSTRSRSNPVATMVRTFRRARPPTMPNPMISMVHVAGSGIPLAKRGITDTLSKPILAAFALEHSTSAFRLAIEVCDCPNLRALCRPALFAKPDGTASSKVRFDRKANEWPAIRTR